jgi:hypothetical protein
MAGAAAPTYSTTSLYLLSSIAYCGAGGLYATINYAQIAHSNDATGNRRSHADGAME